MFLVLCTTDKDNWDGVGNYRGPFPSVCRIPENRRPTALYSDREAAWKEAERLALAHRGETFAVFSMGVAFTRGVRDSTLGPVELAVADHPLAGLHGQEGG